MLDTTGHDMMHFCRRLGRRFFYDGERERAHGALQRTTVVRASTTVMSGPCPALPLLVAPSICPCSSGLETRAMHCQQLGSASRSSPVVSGDRPVDARCTRVCARPATASRLAMHASLARHDYASLHPHVEQ
jgi:hypothetical protein